MIYCRSMPHREVKESKDHRIWRVIDREVPSVTASVVGNGKGKKVIVYKYKRKTGYHKKNGHRQQYTEVKIEKINA